MRGGAEGGFRLAPGTPYPAVPLPLAGGAAPRTTAREFLVRCAVPPRDRTRRSRDVRALFSIFPTVGHLYPMIPRVRVPGGRPRGALRRAARLHRPSGECGFHGVTDERLVRLGGVDRRAGEGAVDRRPPRPRRPPPNHPVPPHRGHPRRVRPDRAVVVPGPRGGGSGRPAPSWPPNVPAWPGYCCRGDAGPAGYPGRHDRSRAEDGGGPGTASGCRVDLGTVRPRSRARFVIAWLTDASFSGARADAAPSMSTIRAFWAAPWRWTPAGVPLRTTGPGLTHPGLPAVRKTVHDLVDPCRAGRLPQLVGGGVRSSEPRVLLGGRVEQVHVLEDDGWRAKTSSPRTARW